MKLKLVYAVLICAGTLILISQACTSSTSRDIREGEALAHNHCSACHAFPEPSLLSKKVWGDVLPKMAELMYVEIYYTPFNVSGPDGDRPASREAPAQLFPYDKWEKIAKYYIAAAPRNQPERSAWKQVGLEIKNFTTYAVDLHVDHPFTSLVRFDTSGQRILIADAKEAKLFVTDAKRKLIYSFPVSTGVTDIRMRNDSIDMVSMGILKPSDEKSGKISLTSPGNPVTIVIDGLQRPLQATFADLNDDEREDIIVSEFGFRHGSLSWFENEGGQRYKKHLLRALPGAVSSEVFDFNKDGMPDIAALMAQGDEGVFIYYNEGGGKFREERVLQFPPVYGSNYFQLLDFNNDGWMDILTTQGDNADYSMVAKAYHGIRIFLNNGRNQFDEKFFLPQYGSQKAIPADFDNDGDMDIAAIAFFPDYEKAPMESFIYWDNIGDTSFFPSTFSRAADGRWLTMDAGDYDGDGDLDLVLGNADFAAGTIPQKIRQHWREQSMSAIILENNLIKGK
jgi:hypothetical protein